MANTLPLVVLKAGVWVDLYAATGLTVGAKISVQNVTPSDIRLCSKATAPTSADGAVNRVLRADATWVEPDSQSKTPNIVQEFGVVENASGAWNGKTLILGGLKFQWSAVSTTGHLTFIKATGSDAPANTAASQMMMKQSGTTFSGISSQNLSVWNTTAQALSTSPTIGSYDKLEYDICTRGAGANTAVWKITAQSNGSTTLILSGTYMGPKYITGT